MQVKQSLVDFLLESEGRLHGFKRRTPLALLRALDVCQDDTSTTLILELHQLLSMFQLLVGTLLEELGETTKCYVIPVEIIGL